jgi:hypothetical protein
MKKKYHICPVCGFEGLKESPYGQQNTPSYEICPCCGFEFGFDKQEAFVEFRKHWIEKGSPWFMVKLKPKNWDLHKQMNNLLEGRGRDEDS